MEREVFGQFIAERRRALGLTQQVLADHLHVTDKAVSKWERGLCYPDLTLLEPLAVALDLTVTELMNCQKASTPLEDNSIHTLLDIADEDHRRQRRKLILSCMAIFLAAALLAGLFALWSYSYTSDTGLVTFVGKKSNQDGYFVYIHWYDQLLQLRCKDAKIYEAITADDRQGYSITFHWNRLDANGTLESCESSEVAPLPVTDMVGSAIGVDSLFDINCPIMEYRNIYPDPQRDGQFIYSWDFYYCGDGKDYYIGKELPETHLVTVRECRAFTGYDYDNDGITELFVLTRYENAPYMLFEFEEGNIVSLFVDTVPDNVAATLEANATLPLGQEG